MKDMVTNGTGNSRYLKTSLASGTTWESALAMLREGTFPIDLNGLNNGGITQLGSAYSKANVLPDDVCALLGLDSTTAEPKDAFGVVANPAELWVWRKTVKNAEDIPAGYTLGDVQTGNFKFVADSYRTFEFGTPSVDDAGNVWLNVEGSIKGNYNSNFNDLKGKFCRPPDSTWYIDASLGSQVIYIPADATFSQSGGYKYVDKYQLVTGYPLTPAAGTTTTYPVSTNPNAYQEGDDAKPAGYALGEVVTGQFKMSERYPTDGYYYKYASSISVADDGTISLNSPSKISFDRYNGGQSYANRCLTEIAGKFVYLANRNSGTSAPDSKPPFNSVPSGVVYIPSDATLTWTEGGALDGFILSKYQPVTGYAAIPAGTTIEYLGKLGDKARVQVVSYVGTGTYRIGRPNSLTFDFVPKLVIVALSKDKSNNPNVMPSPQQGWSDMFLWIYGMKNTNTSNSELHFINDGKNLSWYAYNYASDQCNESGSAYTAVAIG